MVGLALRLRLTLLRNSLRKGNGSTQRQLGFVAGAVGGGAVALLGFTLLAALRSNPLAARDAGVVLFTLLALGWVVLPILTFASDDLLDPTRLSLLPLRRVDLMTLLAVGSVVGVAPLATLLAALGLAAGVTGGPVPVLVAVLAAVLEVGFCVVLSRIVAAALSGLLRSRRGRDIGIALTTLVALSFQLLNPVMQRLIRPGTDGSGVLAGIARPLRWTPPGLLAGAPRLAGDGRLLLALGRLAFVAGLVVGGVVLWERLVSRSLVGVDASGRGRRRTTALAPALLRRVLPAGRTGAAIAKDLRYLTRDPRRGISQLISVLLPAFVVVLGPAYSLGSSPGRWAVFVVCFVAALAGMQGANRFGLDGTSTWMLIATQTRRGDARRDLLGGDIATMVVVAPLLVLTGVLTAMLTDGWSYLPPAFGLALALLLTATAGSGVVAVVAPYSVPDNPRNAFGNGGAGQGCAAGLATLVLLAAVTAACLPLLVMLLPALHSRAWGWALLAVGPAYGIGLAAALREAAARRWAQRGPEVLQVLNATRG